jgi:SusD family.
LERTKEFVFEGHRWFDLVRTGKLKEKVLLAKPSVSVDMNRHILFPIPQREINVNPNLVQNPGY